MSRMNVKRYLLSDKLLVRLGVMLVVALLFLFASWTLSYFLLPEGLLRGRLAGHALAGDDLAGGSVWLEWLRIFAINLAFMLVAIVALNLLRSEHDYPLGYTAVIAVAMLYGVLLGTDSFTFPLGAKMAPTLAILGRSGPYEIAAYALAAVATSSLSKWQLVGKWPKQTAEKLAPLQSPVLFRERWLGLLAAIVLLAAACAWEAYRISLAVVP